MAAILAGNNVEEEYLWSCSLTSTNKEYTWEPATLEPEKNDQEGPKVKPGHRLLIKTAILMPTHSVELSRFSPIVTALFGKVLITQ